MTWSDMAVMAKSRQVMCHLPDGSIHFEYEELSACDTLAESQAIKDAALVHTTFECRLRSQARVKKKYSAFGDAY